MFDCMHWLGQYTISLLKLTWRSLDNVGILASGRTCQRWSGAGYLPEAMILQESKAEDVSINIISWRNRTIALSKYWGDKECSSSNSKSRSDVASASSQDLWQFCKGWTKLKCEVKEKPHPFFMYETIWRLPYVIRANFSFLWQKNMHVSFCHNMKVLDSCHWALSFPLWEFRCDWLEENISHVPTFFSFTPAKATFKNRTRSERNWKKILMARRFFSTWRKKWKICLRSLQQYFKPSCWVRLHTWGGGQKCELHTKISLACSLSAPYARLDWTLRFPSLSAKLCLQPYHWRAQDWCLFTHLGMWRTTNCCNLGDPDSGYTYGDTQGKSIMHRETFSSSPL